MPVQVATIDAENSEPQNRDWFEVQWSVEDHDPNVHLVVADDVTVYMTPDQARMLAAALRVAARAAERLK